MIRGTLEEFSLAEVIRLISQARRTGVLEIKGPTGSGTVHFRDGAICGAESTLSREPLGRKLVRSSVLSESQLWNALSRQEKSSRRLGESLVEAGLAAREDVDTALREQVEDSIVDVLRLEPTEFSWNSEAPQEDVVVLPADSLLSAISERMHELEFIKRHIPSEDAGVSMAPIPTLGADEIRLTLDDWRVLVFLGARRTVRDLLHYSGAGQTQMLRSLERLLSTGLIEVTDPPASGRGRHSLGEPAIQTSGRSGFAESGIIRLPDGGSVSLVSNDVFRFAVVGSSPYGIGPAASSLMADLTGTAPVEISYWSTSGPPAPDDVVRGSDKPNVSVGVRPLRAGQLRDADLVIGLDWSNVADAIGRGSARPEVTFTLLELWALADPQHAKERAVARRARDIVERANARRIDHAHLLSTLEIVQAAGNEGLRGTNSDQIELIEDVCRRVAGILFPQP